MFKLRVFRRPPVAERPLRILIASTPRTGNTWLRHQLNELYEFNRQPHGELAVHTIDAVPWDELPTRCIIQLHWHPVEPLISRLREQEFRVVTVTRNPLAVLVSVLQYCQHIDETWKWLRAEGGSEARLRGATPCSDAFIEYATSPRAAALLSVSPEWLSIPGTLRVRFEDLVSDTAGTLRRLTRSLGHEPSGQFADVVAACTLDRLRTAVNAPHFWQGSPELWRWLLTAEACRPIERAHAAIFRVLGYSCDPDLNLTIDRADATWRRLTEVSLPQHRASA